MNTSKIAAVHNLIASDRIKGSIVCDADGRRLGSIERVMIHKTTGKVAYAILRCGGFLGFGRKHLPVPWPCLSFNPVIHAYELNNVSEDQLTETPDFEAHKEFDWGGRQYGKFHGRFLNRVCSRKPPVASA